MSSGSTAVGASRRSRVSLGGDVLRQPRHAQGQREPLDFTPVGKREATQSGTAVFELEEHPEDKTEKNLEQHVAAANRAHQRDFLAAIESRGKPVADIEQGHISSASCILANVAAGLGRTLEWDAEKGRVVGDEEANRLLKRPYREPWVHPEPADV